MTPKAAQIKSQIREFHRESIPREAIRITLNAWYTHESLLNAARQLQPRLPDETSQAQILDTIMAGWYDTLN